MWKGKTRIGVGIGVGQSSSVLNYIAEYKLVYDSMLIKPSPGTALLHNKLVKTLVDAGVWDKLDFFNFRAGMINTNGEAQINWINPLQSISLINNPTFNFQNGFAGNGTSSYINTNYNPHVGDKYDLNDACVFFYKTQRGANARADIGVNDSNNIINIVSDFSADANSLTYNRINNLNTSANFLEKPTSFTGLWILNRKTSTEFEIWQNKTKRAIKPIASTAIPNKNIYELATNDSDKGYSTSMHVLFGAGKSLTDSDITILSDAIELYFASLEKYDSSFNNSAEMQTGVRSAFSEFEFYTRDELIKVRANPTIYSTYPTSSYISVFENDVFKTKYQFATNSYIDITLTSGRKKVTLVESALSSGGDATLEGTFINSILAGELTKVNKNGSDIVFLGDSITVGGNSTNAANEAFSRLFKIENTKETAILGYGYARLKDFAETNEKINAIVDKLLTLLVKSEKKLVIALGTNDYGLDTTSASTFGTWYGNLLDAINTADSSIEIFCISPIRRTSDPVLLADYRTQISTVCSTRAFTTYINGYDVLNNTTDLDDGVHPTTAGHKKYKDAIYPIIYT